MGVALKQILDRFESMEKIANDTLAANPEALVGVDSMPGSEHDAKVPAEAKKPDEEVTQGQPSDATSTSGAVAGGDAKPCNEGKLEMDDPLLNPEKKPLITDDALTAKVANEHLANLVNDLLNDITPSQKKAETTTEKKANEDKMHTIKLDDDTISKIAAAQATYMMGRKAAEQVKKEASAQAALSPEQARAMIKDACIKAAQEQGLTPEEAAAAADNAIATASLDGAANGAAELPDDVTEEELAGAIVDLVSSGELDPGVAKALVEEIAGDAMPSEDQAAEIIAQGIENGEITPEQAQEIAAAVESGASADETADAAAGAAAAETAAQDASDEAQGAADAEAAAQDAKDEAQGIADAEAALKTASDHIRADAISKVAYAISAKRSGKPAVQPKAPVAGQRVLSKVASILESRKAHANATKQASAGTSGEKAYIRGFLKKAEELGVDPAALARYVCENAKQGK